MNGIASAFTGRLPAGAELKYSARGLARLTFSVAIDDHKRTTDDATEWVRVTCWDDLAERLAPLLLKGCDIYIEGRLKLNEWTGAAGERRAGLSVSAWKVEPLGAIGRRAPREYVGQPA